MKKIFTFKRIVLVVFLIIGILGMISNFVFFNSYGSNFTKEYTTYKQVSSIHSLDELRSKLQELNIEYSIKDSSLTIKDNELVSFSIKNDNTCYVNHNDFISIFSKMDEEDRSVVEIHGISEEGQIKEIITFTDENDHIFTKTNNEYYAKPLFGTFILMIIFILFISIPLAFLLIDILSCLKNKKSQKVATTE